MLRVFSGSCLSLDDHDYALPRLVVRKHVLGSGEDLFDDQGRPRQPQPRTLTKVFSGSALDLNAAAESDSEPTSQGVSPSAAPVGGQPATALGPEASAVGIRSFNDFVDNANGRTSAATGAAQNNRTLVLVIGGSGYLASHVIEQLLHEGYQVRTTVPDMRDVAKLHDLYNMVPEAKHMLFVVEADPFNSTSLGYAMANCQYIVHCGVSGAPHGKDVIQGHNEAVLALFNAVASRKTAGRKVQRVVLTGSYTNVLCTNKSKAPTASGKFDETLWNDSTRGQEALAVARVSLEKEAVRLANLVGVELSVILPAIMIGPARTVEVSEAMRTIKDFALCSPYFPFMPNISWNFVDVRDVAAAHIVAMTSPNANGQRFLVTNTCLKLGELGREIRRHFPHLTAPIYTMPSVLTLLMPFVGERASFRYLWRMLGVRRVLDGGKAQRELQLQPRPLSDTVHDAVASLIHDGHLPSADAAQSSVQRRSARGGSGALPLFLAAAVVATSAVGVSLWIQRRR